MPEFLFRIFQRTDNLYWPGNVPKHRLESFAGDGRIVLADGRGTRLKSRRHPGSLCKSVTIRWLFIQRIQP
jgi:hypothetical protein